MQAVSPTACSVIHHHTNASCDRVGLGDSGDKFARRSRLPTFEPRAKMKPEMPKYKKRKLLHLHAVHPGAVTHSVTSIPRNVLTDQHLFQIAIHCKYLTMCSMKPFCNNYARNPNLLNG